MLLEDHLLMAPEAHEWLYRLTGGHPYFVKLLLAMVWDQFDAAPSQSMLTPDDLQCGASGANVARHKQLNDVLQNVYREFLNDSEREILLWLATKADGHLTAEELRTALGRLNFLGATI